MVVRLIAFAPLLFVGACGGCDPKPEAVQTEAPLRKARLPLPQDPAKAREMLLAAVKETPAPVVVVALDGETLFDAAGRSRRIFLEVLAEAGKSELMRTVAERVAQGAPLRSQADHIRAAGISDPKLLDLLKRRYNERLTSDAYIPDDQARRGGKGFFRALYQAGATLVYIGRDDLIRSGPGWIQVLRNNSFPVLAPRAYLMLPPAPKAGDDAFLKDRFETIAGLGEIVATFQVLKSDAEALSQAFPKAYAVTMQPIGKPDRAGWVDFGTLAPQVVESKPSLQDAGPSVSSSSPSESAP